MTVNISGQVPAEAQNGMVALDDAWLGERTPDPVVAVVIIERHALKFVDADQKHTATMKFRHIEPLEGGAAEQARELLERACAGRGGSVGQQDTELDFPAAEERDIDLDTPLAEQYAAGDVDDDDRGSGASESENVTAIGKRARK